MIKTHQIQIFIDVRHNIWINFIAIVLAKVGWFVRLAAGAGGQQVGHVGRASRGTRENVEVSVRPCPALSELLIEYKYGI